MAEWHATENRLPGEGGGVVRHDDYWEDGAGAAITLERDCTYASVAITCGAYWTMVQTRYFASIAEAEVAVDDTRPGPVALVRVALAGDFRIERNEFGLAWATLNECLGLHATPAVRDRMEALVALMWPTDTEHWT